MTESERLTKGIEVLRDGIVESIKYIAEYDGDPVKCLLQMQTSLIIAAAESDKVTGDLYATNSD